MTIARRQLPSPTSHLLAASRKPKLEPLELKLSATATVLVVVRVVVLLVLQSLIAAKRFGGLNIRPNGKCLSVCLFIWAEVCVCVSLGLFESTCHMPVQAKLNEFKYQAPARSSC